VSSSASRPKRPAGVSRSAQTVGRSNVRPHSHRSLRALRPESECSQNPSLASSRRYRGIQSEQHSSPVVQHLNVHLACHPCIEALYCVSGLNFRRSLGQVLQAKPEPSRGRSFLLRLGANHLQLPRSATAHQSLARPARALVRPNPSLERTATGKALGPLRVQCHHPLRGPSASPASAAQLKR
jgi:hypothetical protein